MSVESESRGDEDGMEITERPSWGQRLWSRTVGVATLYLKKPVLPPLSEYKNLIKRRSNVAYEPQYQNQRGAEGYLRQDAARRQESLRNHDNIGAEVRLLRRLQYFKSSEFEPAMLDFGVGMRMGINQMQLQPVARVRIGNLLTIKGLPEPIIKLSHVLPIHFQGMQAHLRYEVPIQAVMGSVDALWKQPARMLIRFEHGSNSGLHFYPGGLEFGDHTIALGNTGTALRAAAGYTFPRELPYSPEQGGKIELYRLGIKALW